MAETQPGSRHRLWTARIEVGPAFFFAAIANWVFQVAIPRAGDALREQRLIPGFLWFVAGLVLLCWAGITALNSGIRATRDVRPQ